MAIFCIILSYLPFAPMVQKENCAILQPCTELRDCVILNCDTHNDKRVIVTIIVNILINITIISQTLELRVHYNAGLKC